MFLILATEGNGNPELGIYIAIITGGFAVVTSLITAAYTIYNSGKQARASEELERIKSNLESSRNKESSRRTYEFEGRKRLYEEYEPLRFQMAEAMLHAAWRVQSIARSVRRNDIGENGRGWLSNKSSYFFTVVIYDLLRPAVYYRILKKTLTFVDFTLDDRIEFEYRIAKSYYIGFTNDFWLSQIPEARLDYDPNHQEWNKKRNSQPEIYWRQGIPIGRLDSLLESMTIESQNGASPITYSEFQRRIQAAEENDVLVDEYNGIADVFFGFHPVKRPVLWRILIYQVIFSHAYFTSWNMSRKGSKSADNMDSLYPLKSDFIAKYSIRENETPTEEFELVMARAEDDIKNAFSL